MYICKFCKRDLSYLKVGRYSCRTCVWKNKYFGGLYWRTLERDNFTCQSCKKVKFIQGKRTVNVHHINHNPKDNRLENFEVLCIKCHSKKRQLKCIDCDKITIATSAAQKRCISCGKSHEKRMNKARLARFYEKRGFDYYKEYR